MLKPLQNFVLLDITEATKNNEQKFVQNEKGIYDPRMVGVYGNINLMLAKVVDISDTVETTEIKIGDTILVSKRFGHKYDEGDKKYALIPIVDILAVLK